MLKKIDPQIITTLEATGLSKKEVSCYLALLSIGEAKPSEIAKFTSLKRSTTNLQLEQLTKFGLIKKIDSKKVIIYKALSPNKLIDWISKKKKLAEKKAKAAEGIVKDLLTLHKPERSGTKVWYFEGVLGGRHVLSDTLTSKDKTLRSYISVSDITSYLGVDFFKDYTDKRIKYGYSLHSFRSKIYKQSDTKNIDSRFYSHRPKDRRFMKYIGDVFTFPLTMYMYDNKIALIGSEKEGFSLILESDEFVQIQKSLFDTLWDFWK